MRFVVFLNPRWKERRDQRTHANRLEIKEVNAGGESITLRINSVIYPCALTASGLATIHSESGLDRWRFV